MTAMSSTRREFIRSTAAATLAAPFVSGMDAFADKASDIPKPSKAQLRWQDCEFGVIYHFDMPTAAGDYTHNNVSRKVFDPKLYNPSKLDTDQWVHAAKAAGAKYAVFTATHFNGFMQWQSDLYPYGVKQAAWRNGKGDVVGDFVDSCRKADILPGIYMSTHRNVYQTVWGHYVNWGKGRGTPEQEAYNRIAEKQVEELCSRYGKLLQIWFDAGVMTPEQGGPDVLPVFEKYQPDSVFYHSAQRSDHRWIGNEKARVADPCWATMPDKENGGIGHNTRAWKRVLGSGDPDGGYWSPGMADIVLRGHGIHKWFYSPESHRNIWPLENLLKMHDDSVGRNCNLVIGLVVDCTGQEPAPDVKRMEELGKALKQRFSNRLGSVSGAGSELELNLKAPGKPSLIVIQEDIAEGERVRQYAVEGRTPGGNWQVMARGESIGHKRIHSIDPVAVDALRLKIEQSRARPLVKMFACYA